MTSATETTQLTPPVNHQDHRMGTNRAVATLVEYADYQCPYCGDAAQILKGVRQQLGDRLQFVFRNFPLADAHPNALQAAEAAEAAGFQGKFWEMHDVLFEHQRQLDSAHLVRFARQLGLDLDRFEQDMKDHTAYARIQSNVESGRRSGVDQTPSFFIDGERYEGDWESNQLLESLASRAR